MAEQWMEEGGVAALSEIASQLLIEKFGEVPQDMKDGIMNSDTTTLKVVVRNIFRYESVEDVRRYIQ